MEEAYLLGLYEADFFLSHLPTCASLSLKLLKEETSLRPLGLLKTYGIVEDIKVVNPEEFAPLNHLEEGYINVDNVDVAKEEEKKEEVGIRLQMDIFFFKKISFY